MENEGANRYIVDERILPIALLKTVEVKKLLKKGEASTVNEAVDMVGVSRSAYYKYKDYIFPLYEINEGRIITIHLLLSHHKGILSKVLKEIAGHKANILTINQTIPTDGVANVTLAIETKELTIKTDAFLSKLGEIEGVKEISLLARE